MRTETRRAIHENRIIKYILLMYGPRGRGDLRRRHDTVEASFSVPALPSLFLKVNYSDSPGSAVKARCRCETDHTHPQKTLHPYAWLRATCEGKRAAPLGAP